MDERSRRCRRRPVRGAGRGSAHRATPGPAPAPDDRQPAALVLDLADDRIWRTLPGAVSVARGYLPAGEHRLLVDGRDSGQVITVSGQYMLVPVQLLGAAVTVGQTSSFGQLVAAAPAAAPSAATSVPSNMVSPASTAAPAKPAAKPATRPAAKPAAKPAAAASAPGKP